MPEINKATTANINIDNNSNDNYFVDAEESNSSSNDDNCFADVDVEEISSSSKDDDYFADGNEETIEDFSSPTTLPFGFEPNCNDVIIGRGKKCTNNEGNKRLRKIVASKIDDYFYARTKIEKSNILLSAISIVRSKHPLPGKFIKKDKKTKCYYDVGDFVAKEKVSQFFRDALQEFYRSSTGNRKKRRIEKKCIEKQQMSIEAKNCTQFSLDEVNRKLLSVLASNKSVKLHEYSNPRNLFQYDDPYEPTPIVDPLEEKIGSVFGHCGDLLRDTTNEMNPFLENLVQSQQQQQKQQPKPQQILSYSLADEELEEIDLSGLLPSCTNTNPHMKKAVVGADMNLLAKISYSINCVHERIPFEMKSQSTIACEINQELTFRKLKANFRAAKMA